MTLSVDEDRSVCDLVEKFGIHRTCATRIVIAGGFETHRLSDDIVLLLRSGRTPSLWTKLETEKWIAVHDRVMRMLDEQGYLYEFKIKNKVIGQKTLREF